MANRLTKKQKGFAQDYLETGNGTQSALNHYKIKGKDPKKIASVIAVENLGKPRVQEYLESKAEIVAGVVFDLATGAENETVKLNASKDILDRAGFKPVDKSQSVTIQLKGDAREIDKYKDLREEYENKLRENIIND